ncbi:unnamed protein product [Staurois parvus]|uniref:Uncharacterized protein n=1 Tax=Staurois parvus TaxID=386267 RepID=A0ABN9G2H8_9NEOB|nr:unnamed protein product [Staurois parvus]
MGPRTDGPHAAARPVICHGPLYRLLMLSARSRVCHGSMYTASHCCCLYSATLCHVCHFQVSSHCWWFPIFVIGCCYGPPIACCLHATLWLHTLVLAP